MQEKLSKYIRCSREELSKDQIEKIILLITYLEEKKRTISISELIQKNLDSKKILKPQYYQLINSKLVRKLKKC